MSAPPSLPRLLGVKEIAWVLAVAPAQVLRLIRAGKLPASDVSAGRRPRYRVNPAAVAALVLDGRAGLEATPRLAALTGLGDRRERVRAASK